MSAAHLPTYSFVVHNLLINLDDDSRCSREAVGTVVAKPWRKFKAARLMLFN